MDSGNATNIGITLHDERNYVILLTYLNDFVELLLY